MEGQCAISRHCRVIVPLTELPGRSRLQRHGVPLPVKRHLAAKMQHPFATGPADGHGAQARNMVVIGIDLHFDAAADRWDTDLDRDVQHHVSRRSRTGYGL